MGLLNLLKRIPIDLGQGNQRFTTKGKQIALSFVGDGQGKTALDVGCREGAQSRWLQAKGYEVTSIDVESDYEHCILMDANQGLRFPDDSFDLVWCSEVIEHLDDPVAFRREIVRILRPGGMLILTTPNSTFWLYPLMRCFGQTPQKMQNPGHKHFFGMEDMRRIFPRPKELLGYCPLIACGLQIRRGIGFFSPTFVVIEEKRPESEAAR